MYIPGLGRVPRTPAALVLCAAVLFVPGGCGGSSGSDPLPQVLSFNVNSGWQATVGLDAQDVYEFEFAAGALVTIDVTGITGTSMCRVALFAPGQPLSGTNVLTGTNFDASCGGQDADEVYDEVRITTSGLHRLAIGRDWGSSAGNNGLYTLGVTSNTGFGVVGQSLNDAQSQAAGYTEACIHEINSSWSCAFAEDCQDVFPIYLPSGSVLDVTLDNLSGSSQGLVALYAPGVALGGINLLTNNTDDASCFGQDLAESFTGIAVPSAGVYLVTVTRDWGTSAGSGGNYRLTINSNKWIDSSAGQTANDTPSQATGFSCPP